jgi:hypothetical protein
LGNESVVVILSVMLPVTIESGNETLESESNMLVAVTTGKDPMGRIVKVIMTVTGVLVTENGRIFRVVKSIHEVVEKKLPSSKAVASEPAIWREKVALDVLTDPGLVF